MTTAINIVIDRTEDGRLRATSPSLRGESVEAETLGELFQVLYLELDPILVRSEMSAGLTASGEPTAADTVDEDDVGFELDLDYVLDKNDELYRRLAQ